MNNILAQAGIDMTPLFEHLDTVEVPMFLALALLGLVLISTIGNLWELHRTRKELERQNFRLAYLEFIIKQDKAGNDE